MKRQTILLTSIISTLLLTTSVSAQAHCKNGKCFVDLSKLFPAKNVQSKINTFKTLKKPLSEQAPQIHINNYSENGIETIVLDHTKYVMSEEEKSEELTMENAEGTIVLDHRKYVMTNEEREQFFEQERLRQIELAKLEIIEPIIQIEEKIIEKVSLPTSELFCEIPKKAEYHPESNSYECS